VFVFLKVGWLMRLVVKCMYAIGAHHLSLRMAHLVGT